MFEQLTEQTLALVTKLDQPGNGLPLNKTTIAQSLGLVMTDLRGPATFLVPRITPLVNMLPRELSTAGDVATRWKSITAIDGTTFSTAGVEEGKRGSEIALTEADIVATYAGLGREASINWEAVWAGGKEFDNRASLALALLTRMKIQEELVILAGNRDFALGACPTPVATLLISQGALTAQAGNLIYCVALTLEGLMLATNQINGLGLQPVVAATSVKGSVTRTNIDGTTTAHGGGSSALSAASNAITTTGSNLGISATVAAVKGAAGYAWYLGTSTANAGLAAITTVNAVTLLANPVGTQTANAITADNSVNATEFNGFLTLSQKTGSGAYYKTLDNAVLTSDGANGIVEIDAALQAFWDNSRLSPSRMWVHSQESKSITKLVVNAGASSITRINIANGDVPYILGGAAIQKYWNKFTNQWIDVLIHPNISAGTILFDTDTIPYPMSEVGSVRLIRCRRDYYQIEWPWVSRQYVSGVYTDEVLVHRATLSLGVISNIKAS